MTRLFTDGAESGDTLNIYPNPASFIVSSSIKRSGVYSYKENGTNDCWITKTVNNLIEVYARFAFYPDTYQDGYNHSFFQIYDGTQLLLSLAPQVNSTKEIGVYLNTTLKGSGDAAINYDVWKLIEVYYKIHGTDGVIQIKVDGMLDYSFTGDTTVAGKSTFDLVRFGCSYAGYCVWYFDDLAINDTQGDSDNSWCGDGRVIALKPTAAGDSNMLVPTSGSPINNYTMVDEIPHDSDTSYVESGTPNDYDLYNFEACGIDPDLYNISRVWVSANAKDTTTGSGIVAPLIKTSGSEIVSDSTELSLVYASFVSEAWAINPMTGNAWTPEEVDALQAGIKVVQ